MLSGFSELTELTVFDHVGCTNGKIGNVGEVILTEFADAICTNVVEFVVKLVDYILFNINGEVAAFYKGRNKSDCRFGEGGCLTTTLSA